MDDDVRCYLHLYLIYEFILSQIRRRVFTYIGCLGVLSVECAMETGAAVIRARHF